MNTRFDPSFIMNILGVSLLCVPQIAIQNGGFIVTAAGTAAALFYVLLLSGANLKTKTLHILFFFKTAVISACLLRIFSELISSTLLHEKGCAAIAAAMVLTALYGSGQSRAAHERMSHIFIFFILIVLAASLLLPLKNADITRLEAFMPNRSMLLPIILVSLMFFPTEKLYFSGNGKKHTVSALSAVLISGAVLMLAVFIHDLCYEPNSELPMVDLSYSGIFSNTGSRHQEGFLIICITILFYFTLDDLIYLSRICVKKAMHKNSGHIIGAVLIFLISLLPKSLEQTKYLLYAALIFDGIIFLMAVPVFQKIKKLLPAAAVLLLCGCSAVEPESREYILGMFVGETDITLAAAKLSETGSNDCIFYNGKGRGISEAIHDIKSRTGKELYFGHTMLCAIEKKAMTKERLDSLASLFQNDDDLSRSTAVIAVESIDDLSKAKWSGGDIISFIKDYGKKSSALEANDLLFTLGREKGDAVIPTINCSDGEIKLDGGAVIDDHAYVGDLDKQDFEALQWVISDNNEAVITVNDTSFLFKQTGLKKKVTDTCTYTVNAHAVLVQGKKDTDISAAENILAKRIANSVGTVWQKYNCDCLNVNEKKIYIKIKTEQKGT